jgi:hypothetical protein
MGCNAEDALALTCRGNGPAQCPLGACYPACTICPCVWTFTDTTPSCESWQATPSYVRALALASPLRAGARARVARVLRHVSHGCCRSECVTMNSYIEPRLWMLCVQLSFTCLHALGAPQVNMLAMSRHGLDVFREFRIMWSNVHTISIIVLIQTIQSDRGPSDFVLGSRRGTLTVHSSARAENRTVCSTQSPLATCAIR